MTGAQYYWLIAIGAVLILPMQILGAINEASTSDGPIGLIWACVFVYSAVCSLTVASEIWARFGWGAALIALAISPMLAIYWFIRIGGIENSEEFDQP